MMTVYLNKKENQYKKMMDMNGDRQTEFFFKK
jgi:hypothetical protein